MAKKIAIATLVSYNYGNRLQNYALSTVLRDMTNSDVFTLLAANTTFIQRIKGRVKRFICRFLSFEKWACFARFDSDGIRFSGKPIDAEYRSLSAYDAFAIGSDQVWNPDFAFTGEAEYLPQVPPVKKFAYAASFGVSDVGESGAFIAQLLNGIPVISVREEAGAEIVLKLTGRRVPVVLDPTMLLDAGHWAEIGRQPRMEAPSGGYCLKYVLGDDVNSARIEEVASARGLTVIDLNDESLPVGPAEFVWLIRNAGLVCTDSYHASVFSVLFEVPFVIYERQSNDKDMSSRFDTLCRSFGLEFRRADKPSFDQGRIFNTDWSYVRGRLSEERARSRGFLAEALRSVGYGC